MDIFISLRTNEFHMHIAYGADPFQYLTHFHSCYYYATSLHLRCPQWPLRWMIAFESEIDVYFLKFSEVFALRPFKVCAIDEAVCFGKAIDWHVFDFDHNFAKHEISGVSNGIPSELSWVLYGNALINRSFQFHLFCGILFRSELVSHQEMPNSPNMRINRNCPKTYSQMVSCLINDFK